MHRSLHAPAATSAPAGDPGDDGDPPDDDDGGSLPSLLSHPTYPTMRRVDRRRNSVDRMVEGLDGSDLSSIWREDSKLASPKTFSNVGWPPAEGKFMLRKPSAALSRRGDHSRRIRGAGGRRLGLQSRRRTLHSCLGLLGFRTSGRLSRLSRLSRISRRGCLAAHDELPAERG